VAQRGFDEALGDLGEAGLVGRPASLILHDFLRFLPLMPLVFLQHFADAGGWRKTRALPIMEAGYEHSMGRGRTRAGHGRSSKS